MRCQKQARTSLVRSMTKLTKLDLTRLFRTVDRGRGKAASAGASIGATVGSAAGGPVGAAVGGALGAALGVLVNELRKK